MKAWLRWVAGTVGLSLGWAVAWAVIGALIRAVDPNGAASGLWLGPEIGMAPGFLGGILFSLLFAVAASGRGLASASFTKVVVCGTIAGLALGALPFAINTPPEDVPPWLVGGVVIGSMTVLGALTAAGSLALARRARGAKR